ncbi:hypothetical protein BCR35DRAFT_261944 [Leucosporidium creatinivorum]|uniref:Arf-GAP domain-containing protein n=1 Tax=Leucosporidium creatinivorum TaxID=106004 RepID=A0A1Y2G430_9BASI|nr:hypothetical protein BCR35DRAFT_261944 [Leucosporidium creatinivorum]
MSARYTQSKSEAQRHTEILKAMLKKPENKLCADCKRNDPRWASTNLGCFMCIRCSGIHRGMGVHITRIKSVDLDTWSPEQIENIQRWGNKRANAYWEAHLKPGHAPPEHKMESFIRSKYESKRWAMQGPPPPPETLDSDGEAEAVSCSPPSSRCSPLTLLCLKGSCLLCSSTLHLPNLLRRPRPYSQSSTHDLHRPARRPTLRFFLFFLRSRFPRPRPCTSTSSRSTSSQACPERRRRRTV